jgi:ABC-2 type transport system ATP-binding protein
VLLTTQYLEEADRLAQQIAVVDRGTIVAQGTPSQLKAAVGGNVLRIRAAEVADLSAFSTALAGLGGGEPPHIDSTAGEIRLAVKEPSASAEAIRRLDAEGLPLVSVELEQPSLDDVFLSLTGHPAGEQPAEATQAPETA